MQWAAASSLAIKEGYLLHHTGGRIINIQIPFHCYCQKCRLIAEAIGNTSILVIQNENPQFQFLSKNGTCNSYFSDNAIEADGRYWITNGQKKL